MSINEADIYQLTSGSKLPTNAERAVPYLAKRMSKEQIDQICEFIEPFVVRRDKGTYIRAMCIELGVLVNKNTDTECTESFFYRLHKRVKQATGIDSDRKKAVDMFSRMRPYCRRAWIMKVLDLSEKEYEYLKERYPMESSIREPIGDFTIGLMITPELLRKVRTDPQPTEQILNKALEYYYDREKLRKW